MIKNGIISAEEVAELYQQLQGAWLLLRVYERDQNGKAKKFMLIEHNEKKEKLYELFEEDDWDWDGEYMFVFADPNSICKID